MAHERDLSIEATPASKKTILVAEDDEEIGAMLTMVISQETPYEVLLVRSAREVMRTVQEMTPVLFLFDYHLPSMTGIQLYDQLHTNTELAAIPTIMLSANLPMRELEKRNILSLKKPFDIDKLLSLIEQVLG